MIQSQFKKYLISLIIITLSLSTLIAAFNWLADPYMVFGSPRINGFNALKTEAPDYAKLVKAYAINKKKPEAVILGNSIVEIGLDPDHPGWSYKPVYNLSIAAGNVYEILRYFQHVNNIKPPKQVVFGLDFLSFDITRFSTEPETETRLSVSYEGKQNSPFRNFDEIIKMLLSMDALDLSFRTLKQDEHEHMYRYKENGMREYTERDLQARGGYYGIFSYKEKNFANLDGLWDAYQYQNADPAKSPFTFYRQILEIAYENDTDLRMFVTPTHTHFVEIFVYRGIWPKYEEWKRTIVAINEEEASSHGRKPFPIWDFSYSEFTNETVPAKGDTETIMQWYNDPRHFKEELGNLILDRIFDYYDSARVVPDDFGMLLTQDSIDDVLQKIRDNRQVYRETHPDDIAYIQELIP